MRTPLSVRHGDAGDADASPTLKNWPLFEQKFNIWAKYAATFTYKLGTFGYGPTASIKSEQMRKASFKFG